MSARRNESGTASPSGRAGERQLRVQAHSCLVREFTELSVVQELNAHNGAPALPLRSLSAWRRRDGRVLILLHLAQTDIRCCKCQGGFNLQGRAMILSEQRDEKKPCTVSQTSPCRGAGLQGSFGP